MTDFQSVGGSAILPCRTNLFLWAASFKVKQGSFKPLNSERYRGGPPAQTRQRSSRSHKPALREHHPGLRPLCANRGSHPAVGRVLTAPGCSWFESDSSSVSQIILHGPSTVKGARTHSPRPNSFSWAASFNSEAPVS